MVVNRPAADASGLWEGRDATAPDGNPTPVTYRVAITCPEPHHMFTMTVDASDPEDDPSGQACEAVFALLNIGREAIDDLSALGCSQQQVDAIRSWYSCHHDLRPGVRLEVITPRGDVRHLVCDDVGCAHLDGRLSNAVGQPDRVSAGHGAMDERENGP